MQRIVNDPDRVVEEMLAGFARAHPDLVEPTSNPRVLKARGVPVPGKVGIVTGGGSGHKPAFIGYLGRNLVDAVAVGEIFSSPTAQAFYDAIRAADSGQGVVCLYGNYAGDNMNVRMAREMAEEDGIRVLAVVADDDAASAPPDQRSRRRGVAGEVLMWKVAGALAARGASLEEVAAVARQTVDRTRSVGIGLTPCTIPAVGRPNFAIEPGTMEVGIGHHGEPGIRVEPLASADAMADAMLDLLLPDGDFRAGDRVAVLVSGLGATPVMELYILFRRVAERLDGAGISLHRSYVGNYFTSLEMMGVTLTLLKLDDTLADLLDDEAESVGLRQFRRASPGAGEG